MSALREYRFAMGVMVDGQPIPDPYGFSGSDSSLDTSAERDANGMLHRAMVAVKHPLKIEWRHIEWNVITEILSKVVSDRFQFTYPDPSTGTQSTRTCYAGDRSWTCVWAPEDKTYIGNLSFSVIEF